MEEKLKKIKSAAFEDIDTSGMDNLYDIEVKYLGKKGELTGLLKSLGALPQSERPRIGKLVNILKSEITTKIQEKQTSLKDDSYNNLAEKEWIDTSLNIKKINAGTIHPLSKIQYELEDIFNSIGFAIFDGNHVETDYNNFESLNIPADHPARDSQDTFWLKNGRLLRTQTSATQVQLFKQLKPPFRAIVPGRIFRYEATDASHENTFHQVEGFMVGENVNIGDMVYVEKLFLKKLFGKDVEVRIRPGYFPFVEPGYELDFQCTICDGKGCPTCKNAGWVELLGCGMIHPIVLRNGNIDPEKYQGFAFGMGLDRLVMMRYKIGDIRLFQGCDLRQLKQFV